MRLPVFLYCILLITISCNSNNKIIFGNKPLEYYSFVDSALEIITISDDSINTSRIITPEGEYFSPKDSNSFRVQGTRTKIIELLVSDSQTVAYTQNDKKVGKTIFQFDSSKNTLSVLLEDTSFDNLKSAKKYKPDLQTTFLFDYYSKDYLSKFQNKPKVYHCDSVTIYRFIKKIQDEISINEKKIMNTIGKESLVFLLKGELLNKTLIAMDLNPFIRTRSDSLDAIFDMMQNRN